MQPSEVSLQKLTYLRVGMALVFALACAPFQAQADLLGFYSFDDPSAPFADTSGQGNDLQSASVDPTYVDTGGIQGGAFFFDGTQRLISPIDIDASVYPELTMGAWVKTATLSSGLRKIIGQDNGGWDRVIGLDDRNAAFRYSAFDGTGPIIGTPSPVSTNDWTFIAVAYDAPNSQMTFYIDLDATTVGPLSDLTTAASFGSGFSTTAIGGIRPDNNAEAWQGYIDNVFFFNQVLTKDEIVAIRDRGKAAILGAGGDDPDLAVDPLPDLRNLPKLPANHPITVPVHNPGLTKTLHISKINFTGPDAAFYSATTFPATLAPGASGNVVLSLDSQGQVGTFTATAEIQSDDSGNPSISLDLSARVLSSGNLVGFYSFDDSANPLKDDSGNGKTLIAGADQGTSDPIYQAAGGFAGGAYEFDGAQRLVAPININASALSSLTLGAWVKTSSLDPGVRKIIGQDDGGWDRVIGLDTRTQAAGGPLPDPTFRYVAFTGENNFGPTQGDPPPAPESTDAWTFIAASYDQANAQVSLYVDLDASTTSDDLQVITSAAPMGAGTASTAIGSITPGANSESWLGLIDNVFFLSGSLDAGTIKAIRDGGKQALLQFSSDPILSVPTTSPFANLPNASAKTITLSIKNLGSTQPLKITAAHLNGPNASLYTVGALPGSIAPGASGTLNVTFDPNGKSGTFSASLELISNDSVDRRTVISLAADVPFNTLSDSLIGFYTFDDESDPLKDYSGKGNNLAYVTGTEPTLQSGAGYEGSAFEFFGAQHVIAPININSDIQPKLTMGAWVKTSSLASGLRKIMGQDDGGWDRVIGLDNRLSTGGTTPLRYLVFLGNGLPPADTTPVADNDQIWTFIAAAFDQSASQVTLYVDIDASTTDDDVGAWTFPTAFGTGFTTVSIGSLRPDTLDEGWVGLIDNVFFYQTLLTPDQIKTIRNGGAAAILPTSTIQITDIKRTTTVSLTWSSTGGKNYSVQYAATLGSPFTSIATVPGAAGSTAYIDTDATRLSKPAGFYRIQQEP